MFFYNLMEKDNAVSKVRQYASLSAAFLASATTLEAAVIYSDIDPDEILEDGLYNIDLDADGLTDFVIRQGGYTAPFGGIITNYGTAFGALSGGTYGFLAEPGSFGALQAIPVSSGVSVGPAANFLTGFPGSLGLVSDGPYNFSYGAWIGETLKYLGVHFKIAGATHYGWIRLSVTPSVDKVIVHDFAYESIAGQGINTGEGAPVALCETPTGLNSTVITSTKINLNWSPVPGAMAYRVQGRQVGSPSFGSFILTGSLNNKNVGGLVSGTSYEWKIQARCEDGAGGFIISPESILETFTLPSPKKGVEILIEARKIKISNYLNNIDRILLTDLNGRTLSEWSSIQSEYEIPAEVNGLVLISVYYGNSVETKKLIVQDL